MIKYTTKVINLIWSSTMWTIAPLLLKISNIFEAVPLKLNIIRQECCNLSNTNLQFMGRLQIFWFIEENYNSIKLLFVQFGLLHKQDLRVRCSLPFVVMLRVAINHYYSTSSDIMQFFKDEEFPPCLMFTGKETRLLICVPSPQLIHKNTFHKFVSKRKSIVFVKIPK